VNFKTAYYVRYKSDFLKSTLGRRTCLCILLIFIVYVISECEIVSLTRLQRLTNKLVAINGILLFTGMYVKLVTYYSKKFHGQAVVRATVSPPVGAKDK